MKLSPSALNMFLDCPRCFYLEYKQGIHRPRGAFPSLPGGMDGVLKKYFDAYREKGKFPPELAGALPGKPFDDFRQLAIWRSNREGIRWFDHETDAELMGAIDDCLIDAEKYVPVDYKTRGWPKKEDSHTYYQNQLNCYAFLFEQNGCPTAGYGYLLFYSPVKVREQGIVEFRVEPVRVETDPQAAQKTFRAAVKCLKSKSAPTKHSACEYCSWGEASYG